MDLTLFLALGSFVGLLALSAFFSSSETSLFSLNPVQLRQMRENRNPRLALIERLLSQPRRLIVTILIGNELVNVTASVISAAILIRLAGPENSWMNVLIMVPLLLLFGEITPKTLAIRNNVAFASAQSHYIDLFARAIAPLRIVVRAIADFFIVRIIGKEVSAGNILTEDMVRSLARAAVGEGSLNKQEAHYIHQIFDFGEKTVGDVMTVRSQIFFLPISMPLEEIIAELGRTRYSKIPIYEDDRDSVIGILFARDLLRLNRASLSPAQQVEALRRVLRKPYFVSESKRAVELFLSFRKRRSSIAVAVDEFGGVTGLVTIEDLLERIFGDIPSASELVKQEQFALKDLGSNRYRLSAMMTIGQFNEELGTDLPQTDAVTIGGLLLNEFGELPTTDQQIIVEDFEFTVASAVEQRIDEVIVQIPSGRRRTDDTADTGDRPEH